MDEEEVGGPHLVCRWVRSVRVVVFDSIRTRYRSDIVVESLSKHRDDDLWWKFHLSLWRNILSEMIR